MSGSLALGARDLLVRRESRHGTFELRVEEIELRAGEALAVLGPNGSGKSTLLRARAGLETPVRGCVECAGIWFWTTAPSMRFAGIRIGERSRRVPITRQWEP